nr:MAG TPA: protein of unknown function (DUF5471) [Bacteriophage sp.]DAF11743.1 MAG TPA: protein of unknown function (DUF5471) [Bacteriophage sp.]
MILLELFINLMINYLGRLVVRHYMLPTFKQIILKIYL